MHRQSGKHHFSHMFTMYVHCHTGLLRHTSSIAVRRLLMYAFNNNLKLQLENEKPAYDLDVSGPIAI